MKKTLIALLLISSMLLTGCSSSITAVSLKGPNKNKKAIPYYLPQPYLLITKDFSQLATKTINTEKTTTGDTQEQAGEASKTQKKETSTTAEPVSITVNGFTYQIIYLPNLAEKYGLVYNTGSGVSDLSFTLKDGWMFTGLNLKSDAQIDETITAMSSLVGNIAKIVSPSLTIGTPSKGLTLAPELGPEVTREPKLEPAIWLFKMTLDGEKITFDRVFLDFKI
ncbi:MAG: hypothetical protein WAK60_08405 [Sedimentisphaerales bacterium]